jgi:hypothetical protein
LARSSTDDVTADGKLAARLRRRAHPHWRDARGHRRLINMPLMSAGIQAVILVRGESNARPRQPFRPKAPPTSVWSRPSSAAAPLSVRLGVATTRQWSAAPSPTT